MNTTSKLKTFFSLKQGTSLAVYLMVVSVSMLGSMNAHASSVPMLFNFEETEFSGTFSYDDTTGIQFPGTHPEITAFDVDSLNVTYLPSTGVSSSWDLSEATLGAGERIAVFFDAFGGGAIGATTGAAPAFDTLSAIFNDTVSPFASDVRLDFSSSLDDSSGSWKIVQGATRVLVGGGTDRSFYTVSEVPIPAAAWLFGSGLIGLIGLARRKA